jgi:PKD repeat protein
VDDDNNAPNTLNYYTAALDDLRYDYDIFTVGTGAQNGPDLQTMQGYNMVFWFSGDKSGAPAAGPNSTDEANLVAYLDGGGKLFLDSQEYLDEMGVTAFAGSYLGVSSKTNDTGNASNIYGVTGDPIGDGLGPYHLSYPPGFYDGGDIVNAGAGASVAFRSATAGGGNPLDLDKDGGDWQTVFFGTSWVPVYHYSAANGEMVLQRVVDFFGGCPCEAVSGTSFTYHPQNLWVGQEVTFTGSALGSLPIVFDWDFGDGGLAIGEVVTHTYAAEGDFTVLLTATNACGLESVSQDLTLLNPPDISLDPLSFDRVLTAGETADDTLLVSNLGSVTLTFDIAEAPAVDWLVVDPPGGEVSPGEGLTATLSFEAGVLPVGIYTTTLEINSNDPDEPLLSLPVTLTVCTPISGTDFTWTPVSPFAGEVVTFTASVSGSEPISFYWEFSDGITSTAESPARTFAPGVYTVTLTTSNACGVDMITYTITIAASPWRSTLPLVSK